MDTLERAFCAAFAGVITFLLVISFVFLNKNNKDIQDLKSQIADIQATTMTEQELEVVGNFMERDADLHDSIFSELDKITKALDQINTYHASKK